MQYKQQALFKMNPTRIILHHSLTKDSKTVSVGAIRKFHKDLGWSDIGYHFLIEQMRDDVEIVCGRMLDKSGAHTRGFNSDSIGVCFIGNYDIQKPSKAIWNAGIKLVSYLMREYNIKSVHGHNDYNENKTCPGLMFDMAKFQADCMG